jgi:hypothetical protein
VDKVWCLGLNLLQGVLRAYGVKEGIGAGLDGSVDDHGGLLPGGSTESILSAPSHRHVTGSAKPWESARHKDASHREHLDDPRSRHVTGFRGRRSPPGIRAS